MSHREQIEHIKAQLNISTDIELAKILGTSKNNVYSYAIRGIPMKKILQLQRMGITVCGSDASNVVQSKQPAPEISPPIITDCDKISAEMETVRGMMEFYRSELEKAKNEIIALYKDKVELKEHVARLEAEARQHGGRSMVERGNTANASEFQKIIA